MTAGHEQGWFTDPFALHEHRWMSDGQATRLVRDSGTTSYDPSPDRAFVRAPEAVVEVPAAGGGDLRRADDAERGDQGFDASTAFMAEMDAVWSDGAPMNVLGHHAATENGGV
jgi:hypothetical protein